MYLANPVNIVSQLFSFYTDITHTLKNFFNQSLSFSISNRNFSTVSAVGVWPHFRISETTSHTANPIDATAPVTARPVDTAAPVMTSPVEAEFVVICRKS